MVPSLRKEALAGPFWLYHRRGETNYPFYWHYHAECEIFVSTAGQGECLVSDSLGQFRPNQVFYLPPMVPHCFHTPRHTASNGNHECYVLFFSPDSDLCSSLSHFAEIGKLQQRWPGGVRFPSATSNTIIRCMEKIDVSEGLSRAAAFVELLSTLFACQKGEPLGRPPLPVRSPPEQTARRMTAIGSYLYQHCTGHIALEDVAHAAGMSVPSLCRFFKQHTGRTIFKYLQELRVSHVCRLLTETTEPITQIAFDSGYVTLPHFNRSFHEIKGMTPRQYRQSRQTAE